MASDLSLLPQIPFLGKPYAQPIGICTPRSTAPRTVAVVIDWSEYGASSENSSLGVGINLIAQAVQLPLDAIRSVYIDNTFSINTIYVQFPDTGFTLVAPPGGIVCAPVFTGNQQAIVFGTDFVTGQLPLTSVHFSNVDLQGFYIPATQSGDFINPVTLTYHGSIASSNPGTDFNIGPFNIGMPTNDRLIVLFITAWHEVAIAGNLVSCTLDGDAGIIGQNRSVAIGALAAGFAAALVRRVVPTGTALNNIAISYGANAYNKCRVDVYSIKNLTNTLLPLDSAGSTSGILTTHSQNLDMTINSVLICGGIVSPVPETFLLNATVDGYNNIGTGYNSIVGQYYADFAQTRNVQLGPSASVFIGESWA